MKTVHERVKLRIIRTGCCGTVLCWVNPRLPNFCPECATRIYPDVKQWILENYDTEMIYKERN